MKDFIPYNEALALKELGFDNINCLGVYFGNFTEDERSWDFGDADGFVLSDRGTQYYAQKGFREGILAPLYSQVFRWFREEHDLKGYPVYRSLSDDSEQWWDWLIIGEEIVYKKYNSYEEAELACLRKLIEIVKTK